MTQEYQLPDGTRRLVTADVCLSGDDTVVCDEATADEHGLVPAESHQCDECDESFSSAQGLANHERTHNESDN